MSISSDAKDIATYFVNSTNMKASKALMSRTIVQAKSLLSDGFTKDEIIKTIDYVINVKKVDLHSFGYINVVISDMLPQVLKYETRLSVQDANEKVSAFIEASRNEVRGNDESTNRNKSKINGFGLQPRFREELDFDMFERP
jgi:hypothetical protein